MKQQERPKLHFTPPFGWMNDPNGLIYNNHQYHLFYQYYPQGTQWGPTHWGHATSKDLVKWEHLPIAFSPDESGMCFSGSSVSDIENRTGLFSEQNNANLLAYYTLAKEPDKDTGYYYQAQNLELSEDGGFSWKKYENNPIMEDSAEFHFRDPCVFWYAQDCVWVMVITLGQKIGVYNSRDGVDWIKVSEFGEQDGAHDDEAWECPDLFPLVCKDTGEQLWVLSVALQCNAYTDGSGTQYFVGSFDGKTFTNIMDSSTVLWLDYGRDFYRVQTFSEIPEDDGRRIGLAWMSCWPYANYLPTNNWRSSMSFPREYTLNHTDESGYYISQSFVRELDNYFAEAEKLDTLIESFEYKLDFTSPLRFRFILEFEENSIFKIWCNERTEISLHNVSGCIKLFLVRRGKIGEEEFDDNYPHNYSVNLGKPRTLDIELLLDNGSSELLVDNGKFSMTNLAYQFSECPNSISIIATNNIKIISASLSQFEVRK